MVLSSPADPNSDPNAPPPAPYVMFPPPGIMYGYPPPPAPPQGYGPFPPSAPPVAAVTRAKRKQVKMACTNCASACKRCDEARPCQRCQKYGLVDSCRDGVRKARKVGTKRGPYKRKSKLPAPEASPYPGLLTLSLPELNLYLIFPCRVSSQWRRFVVWSVGPGEWRSPLSSGSDAAPVPPSRGILAIPVLSSPAWLRPASRWPP
ncbi:hypothetical protein EI94DRAFT_953533 [Lactarius quietus]|nr:hypothetical protein EI94DRAFT_953533 [Lactarius quietus]